jgi:hypothetical protein
MLTGLQIIEGKSYYFETESGETQGQMYRNRKTPEGYWMTEDGIWDGLPAEPDA